MARAHDDGTSMPADAPFYPALPAHYRHVQFQFVFFEASLDAVRRVLPEPLEPDPEGLCVAIGLVVPFCSNYGSFREAILEQKCRFHGQTGWYCSHVFHDGPIGIAAGREIYGTPKIYSAMDVKLADRAMTTKARLGDAPVLTITSTLEQPPAANAMTALTPAWRLKVIPRADGPGPALKQLVDAGPAMQNLQVHDTFVGRGRVHFEANALCDLSDFAPRSYRDAYFLEASYSEGYGKIVHDYLV